MLFVGRKGWLLSNSTKNCSQ